MNGGAVDIGSAANNVYSGGLHLELAAKTLYVRVGEIGGLKMGRVKKHHYLPQFSLRGFAAVDGGRPDHIWRVQKKQEAKHHLVNIADAAAQSDYHTVSDRAGNRDGALVEQALSPVERAQSEMLVRVATKQAPAPADVTTFAEFVSLMICRVPGYKDFVDATYRATANLVLDKILQGDNFERGLAAYGGPKFAQLEPHIKKAIADRARRIAAGNRLRVDLPNAAVLGGMFGIAGDPRFVNLIQSMGVMLCEAPASTCFVTGDAPVAFYYPSRLAPGQEGAGIADPRIELTIPLSAHCLAHLDWASTGWRYETATMAQVVGFNRRTVVSALDAIFAPQVSPELIAVVRENYHLRAGNQVVEMRDPRTGGRCFLNRAVPVFPASYYGPAKT
ncbi:MAG: DUF4238 domain-containing protein [Phycisphaerae bacterium]